MHLTPEQQAIVDYVLEEEPSDKLILVSSVAGS